MAKLADLLVRLAPEYLRRHTAQMPRAQRRALTAIQQCRTPALGGHLYRCTHCQDESFGFHSCHHRACPRCGAPESQAWSRRQTERLLPVPYFLVTFTLPGALRPIARRRPELLHDLLFGCSAAALQGVAALPRHLGAELGFVGVLHTWTRQLAHHPHIHYIVAGGGLSADGKRWRRCRQPDWLLPVRALSACLRRLFEAALRAAAPQLHAEVADSCWQTDWVVHSQPAGSGAAVVRYLARYVFRTALSDERLVASDDRTVTFSYVDSRTGKPNLRTLSCDEFMRRYLQHVLPPGQHRVRYFGWMHPARKKRRLLVETLLSVVILVRPKSDEPPAWHLHCPHCDAFARVVVARLPRGPPHCRPGCVLPT